MKLRSAKLEDAPGIARVHVQCWQESYPGIIADSLLKNLSVEARVEAWRENLSPEYQGPRFNIVAEDATHGVLGFASGGPQREKGHVEGYSGELWAIYLLKKYQGKGLGRALFNDIKEKLRLDGHTSMLVWVLENNPSEKFYAHLGGKFVGSKKIMIDREHNELAYGWEKI